MRGMQVPRPTPAACCAAAPCQGSDQPAPSRFLDWSVCGFALSRLPSLAFALQTLNAGVVPASLRSVLLMRLCEAAMGEPHLAAGVASSGLLREALRAADEVGTLDEDATPVSGSWAGWGPGTEFCIWLGQAQLCSAVCVMRPSWCEGVQGWTFINDWSSCVCPACLPGPSAQNSQTLWSPTPLCAGCCICHGDAASCTDGCFCRH